MTTTATATTTTTTRLFASSSSSSSSSLSLFLKAKRTKKTKKKKKRKRKKKNKTSMENEATTTTTSAGILDTTDMKQQEQQQEFATTYHSPVMVKECVEALLKRATEEEEEDKAKKRRHRRREQKIEQEHLLEELQKQDNASKDEDNNDDENNDNQSQPPQQQQSQQPRIFIDGTLGGGGHSEAILKQLRKGDILIGCDVDGDALEAATKRLDKYTLASQQRSSNSKENVNDENNHNDDNNNDNDNLPLFIPIQANFGNLHLALANMEHPFYSSSSSSEDSGSDDDDDDSQESTNTDKPPRLLLEHGVDGILLDLGVSSHQINTAQRGFAFSKDGPLDMRMSGGGGTRTGDGNTTTTTATATTRSNNYFIKNTMTAADVCNEFDVMQLVHILRLYGDEPRAKQVASSIVESRPLTTTMDLYNAVARVTPEFVKASKRRGRTATLARVFQALRIVVNQEDEALRQALEEMCPTLCQKQGARLVILSYHSMEDRAAKCILRDGMLDITSSSSAAFAQQQKRNNNERDMYGNLLHKKPWKPVGKKRKPTPEEVQVNSRARSATLRVGERTL